MPILLSLPWFRWETSIWYDVICWVNTIASIHIKPTSLCCLITRINEWWVIYAQYRIDFFSLKVPLECLSLNWCINVHQSVLNISLISPQPSISLFLNRFDRRSDSKQCWQQIKVLLVIFKQFYFSNCIMLYVCKIIFYFYTLCFSSYLFLAFYFKLFLFTIILLYFLFTTHHNKETLHLI